MSDSRLTRVGFNRPQKLEVATKRSVDSKISLPKGSGSFSATGKTSARKTSFQIHKTNLNESPLSQKITQKEVEAEYQQWSPEEKKSSVSNDQTKLTNTSASGGLTPQNSSGNVQSRIPAPMKQSASENYLLKQRYTQDSPLVLESRDSTGSQQSEMLNSAKLSKLPSYLTPTYAALQSKKDKIEAVGEKSRFTFGRRKSKITDYLDWGSKRNQSLEKKMNLTSSPQLTQESSFSKLNSITPKALGSPLEYADMSPKFENNSNKSPGLENNSNKSPGLENNSNKSPGLENKSKKSPTTRMLKDEIVEINEQLQSYDESDTEKEESDDESPETDPKKKQENSEGSSFSKVKAPMQSFPSFMPDRYKTAYEFLKLDPIDRKIIEKSFRLNPDAPKEVNLPSPYKKRESNSGMISKILQERLENSKKNLVDSELFATTRNFWNSGPNKDLTPEERQNLMFKIDDVHFFKLNAQSTLNQLIKTDNDVIERNTKAETRQNPAGSLQLKNKAIIAQFNMKNQVIQPIYMNDTGSMCFTEFWSDKQRHKYYSAMKKKVKQVKVPNSEENQYESVYRPERIKNVHKVKQKINQQNSSFGTTEMPAAKPEYKRFAIAANTKRENSPLTERRSYEPSKKFQLSPVFTGRGRLSKIDKMSNRYGFESLQFPPKKDSFILGQGSSMSEDQETSQEELPVSKEPVYTQQKLKKSKFNKTEVNFNLSGQETKSARRPLNSDGTIAARLASLGLQEDLSTNEPEAKLRRKPLHSDGKISAKLANQGDFSTSMTEQTTHLTGNQAVQTENAHKDLRKNSEKGGAPFFQRTQTLGFTGGSLKDDYDAVCKLYKFLSERFV